ncbi:UDP-glycosyltransferase 76C2 [Heracleum sosnowskyi]|uniref:UDP-glycosyltransferase 76C2 n=1 Tax=Heracleum sosnowskyi TaxID=360622 RepID=A0AAD8H4S3_9APIA|nr:UDP-glycosyltransferase 76C2 [Heracleum sosnowskyi]
MEKQEAKSKLEERKMSGRLLLFPFPFQGHINPMLQLANILYSKGFNITIIHTLCNSPNKSNYPHFTFETISEESLTAFPTMQGSVTNVVLLNKVCVDPFRDCVKRLLSNSDRILCLVTDALLYFTQAVADGLKLPRIVLRTSSLSAFQVLYLHPLLLQKGYLSVEDSNSEAPVPEVQPLKVKDILRTYKIEGEDLEEIISGMMTGIKAASAIIWNTFEELEQSVLPTIQQNFPIPSFTIGPFHKYFTASGSSLLEQDQSAISWLDMQAPLSVLYPRNSVSMNVNIDSLKKLLRGRDTSVTRSVVLLLP